MKRTIYLIIGFAWGIFVNCKEILPYAIIISMIGVCVDILSSVEEKQ